jgi:hypothetical protein
MATKNLGRVQGLSAYEVWLEQGNTGTEQDFINSLKAENGKFKLYNWFFNATFPQSSSNNITSGQKTFFEEIINDAYSSGYESILVNRIPKSTDVTKFPILFSGNVYDLQKKPTNIIIYGSAISTKSQYATSGDANSIYYASLKISGTWSGEVFTVSAVYWDGYTDKYLIMNNNYPFTPTKDYNPATKIYVDNKIAEAQLGGGDVDLSGLATKDELATKVDKVTGKSLVSDSEIERLANVTNYDDTELKEQINSKATISDMTTYIEEHKEELKGADGQDGAKGTDGISATHSWNGTTLTITSASGTSSANLKGDTGATGSAGKDGTNGVGISSVTQTTTSTADGGTNVITVTKTDGTTSTFSVKNGSKGSTGANGYTPVKGTDYWTTSDKDEIINEVTGSLDIEGIPSYVKEEAERCAKVVQCRQNENTMTAILSSDYHLPNKSHAYYSQILESITHAGQAMGILRKRISRDFEAKLGDILWDSGETIEEAVENIHLVHSLVSERGSTDEFEANGNHDHLQSSETPFTDSQVFSFLGIYNKGAVFDETNRKGGYCYRDYEDFCIRVILLNTSETDTGSFVISAKQIAWLQKALAVKTADGWGTIILSHHPLDWGGTNTQIMSVIKASNGVICNIHGHVHTYTEAVITGTTIPRLAIPNVCFHRTNEYGENGKPENAEGIEFGTTESYEKVAKTAEDTSFCVMTVDRIKGKLYLDHYGAGIDREIDIPIITKGYTNLVPLAQTTDKTSVEVFNGVGYTNGCYATSNTTGTDAECVTTGLIPYGYKRTDPIYVKGATIDTSKSHCRIFGFNASKEASFQSAQGSSLTNYFDIETLGTDYYKVTPLCPDDISKITDFLRFSLIGTGENLIITINEPLE